VGSVVELQCMHPPHALPTRPFPCKTCRSCWVCCLPNWLPQAAEKELPGLGDDLAAGKFSGLKAWLNEKIHSKGSLYASGDELMVAVTGSPLDPSIFLGYLREKYTELYKL
jgi:hypothetical protein